MKNYVLSILMFIFLAGSSIGQPTTMIYQGKLLDNQGAAITLGGVQMHFAIYDTSSGGDLLWPSAGTVVKTVDIDQGLYSVRLGTGIGDDELFTAGMFNGKEPWLEVRIDTVTMPRTPMSNTPFSLLANDLAASGWASPGSIGSTTPNTGAFTAISVSGNASVNGDLSTGGVISVEPVPENNAVSGITSTAIVDTNTVGFAAALYIGSDGNYSMAKATGLNRMPCVALAVEPGTGDKKILLEGYVRNDAWNWTVGKLIFVSLTDGVLTQAVPTATGSQVQIVGYATHANRMYFSPNLMLIELK